MKQMMVSMANTIADTHMPFEAHRIAAPNRNPVRIYN